MPDLCLLALGRLENPVHRMGGLVYGMGKMTDAVHRMGGLVYGDNDYDVAARKGGLFWPFCDKWKPWRYAEL